jgi:GxxExxY protein
MRNYSLSVPEEQIAAGVVNAAYTVHKALGPGLLESIYEVCFCHELTKQAFNIRRQVTLPIVYDGIKFEEGLRLDVLVEELVICELKATEELHPVYVAQLLSQLKLANKRLGFLITSMSR